MIFVVMTVSCVARTRGFPCNAPLGILTSTPIPRQHYCGMTLPERMAADICRIICTSPTSTPEQETHHAKAGFTRSRPFDMRSALPQVATCTCSCIKYVIQSTTCPGPFVDTPSIKTLLHSSFISQTRLPARLISNIFKRPQPVDSHP